MSKRRTAVKSRQPARPVEPPWTPQTRAKLRGCQIRALCETGFLTTSHQQGAYEILKALRTVAAAGYRSAEISQLHVRGAGEWSPGAERLVLLLQAWWREMHDYGLDPGYVYDLVQDGAEVPLAARPFLRRALDLYVKLPGFRLEKPETI